MLDAQLVNVMKIQKIGSAPRKKGLIILGIILACVLFLLKMIMGSVIHIMTSGMIDFFLAVYLFLVVHFIYNNRKLSDSVQYLSDEIKERMEEDCLNGLTAGNVILCRDGFLLVHDAADAVLYNNVIYVFERDDLFVYDRNKQLYLITLRYNPFQGTNQLKLLNRQQFWEELTKRAPWAYFGKTNENQNKFKVFSQMVREVDERREHMKG